MNEPNKKTVRRVVLFYTDRQGKAWELRKVRASESVPQFIHAEGGDTGTPLRLHVGDVRVAVVEAAP